MGRPILGFHHRTRENQPASLTVDPFKLATVIGVMLRGVALQALLDDEVDLGSSRAETEQLLIQRLR